MRRVDPTVFADDVLAAHQDTLTEQVAQRLAGSEHWQVRAAVSVNPAAPPAVLTVLAGDSTVNVRDRVARNPSTPVTVLVALADDVDARVVGAAATHPSLPLATRTALATHSSRWVRQKVAEDRYVPVDVLIALAADDEARVRAAAASNPAVPDSALLGLAGDPDRGVRRAVARRLSDPAVLVTLSQDKNIKVRQAALANPATPALAKAHGLTVPTMRSHAAQNITDADLNTIIEEPTTSSGQKAAAMTMLVERHGPDVLSRYRDRGNRKMDAAVTKTLAAWLL